jgi:signal transduction histidine kinase
MRLPRLPIVPATWLRLPPRTARLRLTVLYSGLFFLLGVGMLVVTNVLVHNFADDTSFFSNAGAPTRLGGPSPHATPTFRLKQPPASTVEPPIPTQGTQSQFRLLQQRTLQEHAYVLHELLIQSEITVGIMTVVSLVPGWFIAGRVLRRVQTITETAREISASNLNERLALEGPNDEFKQLADTLDDLIARLEASFEAQRHFVANASHELRTPLTLERTLLQIALADPGASSATLRSTCQELLEAGRQQERLIDSLLTLASSESGLECREPIDLAAVTSDALRLPRAEIKDKDLLIETAIRPAAALGNRDLACRLVANLLDNAVRYNQNGGRVEVSTQTRDGRAVVSVANTGPVIMPAEVDRLFQPFQRLNTARAHYGEGHGLGLSIVRSIAAAHDATIAVRTRDQGGLCIEVAFPEFGQLDRRMLPSHSLSIVLPDIRLGG